MSKIYEALQNAEQESRELEKPKNELAKTAAATLLPSVVGLDFDYEMITLYQNIESRLPDMEKKVIQFISSREGEGTSTIVREFARTTAKIMDKSVFLLDAGDHNSKHHVYLRITPDCALEEVAREEVAIGTVTGLSEQEDEDNSNSPNWVSAPLNFYSPLMHKFWECLKERYDLILVDSAAVSKSPEGIEIARRVDGVVLVVEAEKTRWQVVENLKEKIQNVGGNIIGVVFNKRRFYIPEALYKRL
jgi:Mrp family chromosome partitioning ATPase